MHDLIVIGAGPAGSTSSYIASLLGLKTLIIDFQEFPRFKPCGGGLTVKSLKLLESLDIDIDSIVEKYCKRVYLITYSGVYELVSSEPIITTVSREVFDKHLLQHALDQGVEFMLDKIVSIECRSDEVIVRGLRDIYRAKVLIGADGAFSITAKFLGNHVCMRDCAIAYMSYVEDSHIDYAVLDFTRIKYGYAWIFPKRNSLNIGVGSLRIENYTKVLIDYVSELNLKLRFVRGYPLPIK
ncbi:MAG: geranylgeranyl reductase, partial [Thermoprotei archaeon ex4572_64]